MSLSNLCIFGWVQLEAKAVLRKNNQGSFPVNIRVLCYIQSTLEMKLWLITGMMGTEKLVWSSPSRTNKEVASQVIGKVF